MDGGEPCRVTGRGQESVQSSVREGGIQEMGVHCAWILKASGATAEGDEEHQKGRASPALVCEQIVFYVEGSDELR